MGFLQILADLMRSLLDFPMRFIAGIKSWRQQRTLLQLSTSDIGKEVQEAKGIKGFFKRLGKIFLIILLIVILCLFFWLLYWLNNSVLGLPRMLGGLPWLRPYWLPVLVVLFVGTFYLAMRLWRLLGPERDANAFPELDLAWTEAEAALVQAGIDLRKAPLFLIIGKPAGSIDAMFSASRITWLVRQTPMRVDAPIQVYAHREAIFVALGQHSVVGQVLDQLAKSAPADTPLPKPQLSVFEEPPVSLIPVNAAESKPADPLASPNLLADEPAPRNLLAAFDQGERVPTLEELTARQTQSRWKPLADEAVDTARRRMTAMVSIIARSRRPFCAVNGALVVVPQDGLTNATDAGEIAAALDDDLRILAAAGQTRCPAWLLVADLHTLPGFDALFSSLDPERRQRLLGRDFPLQPDLTADAVDAMVSTAIESFIASLSALTQKLFLLESLQVPTPLAIATNGKLFELIEHLQQRQAGLEILVRRIIHGQSPGGVYFGGFYLAATGADPATNQAFVPGVLRLMLDQQNKVTWTDEALEEEADYQRWANFGYASMAIFCIILVVLGYWRWQGVG